HPLLPRSPRSTLLPYTTLFRSPADWAKLKAKIQADGLYNAYRLAVAPNGSTSYIGDSTSSLHPIINRIEERQEKMIGKIYYPAPDRKSTRLNSSHVSISYAVFC